MKPSSALLAIFIVIATCNTANAMTSHSYGLIEQSIYLLLSLVGVALAVTIFSSLKGGSLGNPWFFFILGFTAAGLGSIIELLDLFKFLISQYDLRLILLIFRTGSMLLFLTGLFLYKKGLQ
jgi:hypothetical protein